MVSGLSRRRGWRRRCWDRRRSGRCCRSCARGSRLRRMSTAGSLEVGGDAPTAGRASAPPACRRPSRSGPACSSRTGSRRARRTPPAADAAACSLAQPLDGDDARARRAMAARFRQAFLRTPSTSTVQAPHWPWSQPFLVPVRPRCSRKQVEQGGARIDLQVVAYAVHGEADIDGHRSGSGAGVRERSGRGRLVPERPLLAYRGRPSREGRAG